MKKGKLWIVLGMAAVLGLTGCGAGSKYDASSSAETASYKASSGYANSYPQEEPAVMNEEAYDMAEYETAAAAAGESTGLSGEVMDSYGIDSVAATSQKLIKTVDLNMETKEFDTLLSGITTKAQELGGYVESSEIDNGSYYYSGGRYARLTLRIPADRLDGFVSVVSELGNVTWKNEQVQDVTLEYVDVESHKKALSTEQERLLELLENAETMEDILQIESRLSQLRYELQFYESRLRTMDNQVNYSTVSMNISEVERITEVQEKTFLEEVSYRLSDNFYDISQGARGFAIWFLSSLPYLAIWAVVIFLTVWIIRRMLRKRKQGMPEKTKKGWRKASKDTPAEETEKDENFFT